MNPTTLHISASEANAAQDDRFHRFKLIGWWDQQRLRNARVLVIGAGALGNELIKNLALLGVGNVLVADLDRIENSNLSRSVLYRQQHNGQSKAVVAAAAAKDIYPDLRAQAFHGNVVYDLGLGVFHWADVVLGGLDNREARLAINRACWKLGKPWIDGAIEQISGLVRVFDPRSGDAAPCYECTMSQTDWKLLQIRRSCNLLSRQEMTGGKTPTTPTISSIIAGVQTQEAVKLLHGLETLAGQGWTFTGLTSEVYPVSYPRKPDCHSHDPLERIEALDASAATLTGTELLRSARELLGEADVQLELGREMLAGLHCEKCGRDEELYASLGQVSADKANCPHCGARDRAVQTYHTLRGNEPFLHLPLAQLGVPAFDIIGARSATQYVGLELSGDAGAVLGELHDSAEDVEWL